MERLIETDDMQLYSYFISETRTNSYILWHRNRQEALLIDPVVLDTGFFEILESNNLDISGILLTHADEDTFTAVKTIPRIYNGVTIYGGVDRIFDLEVENVKKTPRFFSAGFAIDPIFLPGHHSDSLVYLIRELLFTGDILGAGTFALADGGYGRALLAGCIQESLFSFTDHTMILPLFGPPSTIAIEKETNLELQEFARASI